METVIVLLTLFGIKHFLADFLWQFPFMVQDKSQYGASGGMTHASLHGVLTFFVLIGFARPEDAVTLALIDSFVHYHIDWAKMKLNSKLGWSPTTHEQFWWLLGLDQYLHAVTYVVFVALIT